MFELNVTITDAFTGGKGHVSVKGKLGMSIDQYYNLCQKFHPDAFINFYWNDGKDFIFGQPLNMKADEQLIDEDKMTFDEYMNKWFSN